MFAFKLVANPIGGQCTSLTGWLLALGAIIILGWKFFTRTKRASLFGSFVSVKEKRFSTLIIDQSILDRGQGTWPRRGGLPVWRRSSVLEGSGANLIKLSSLHR